MPFVPYTDLIPITIGWAKDETDYWRKFGMTPPNPRLHGARQLWRDTAVKPLDAPVGYPLWMAVMGILPPATGECTYNVLARKTDGSVDLQPVDAPVIGESYSQACVGVYRQYRHLFGLGVPYYGKITVPAEDAREMNFAPGRGIEYPIEKRTDTMLIPGSLARMLGATAQEDVCAIHYQEFLRLVQTPAATTTTQRLAMIRQTLDATIGDELKLSAIRQIVTQY